MKKVVTLIFVVSTLASCATLQGTWANTRETRRACYSETDCVPYYTVPGEVFGCKVGMTGTIKFNGNTGGEIEENRKFTFNCPGYNPFVRNFNAKTTFKVVTRNGKTYLYYTKKNGYQELVLGRKLAYLTANLNPDQNAIKYFTVKGAMLPKYIRVVFTLEKKGK